MNKKFVVAVTGASGMVYARRLLDVLQDKAEVHLIISDIAHRIAKLEGVDFSGFDVVYADNDNMFACSMKTLAAIASGFSDNLITRTADVCLKEGRKCILMPREMPLSRIHLKNMLTLDEAGATIMVISPAFYTRPQSIEDLVDMVVARVLDHLNIDHTLSKRWRGEY